jgi:hypothetical protein
MAQSTSRSSGGSRPSTNRSQAAKRSSSRSAAAKRSSSRSPSNSRSGSARKSSSSRAASAGSNGKTGVDAVKNAVASGTQSTKDALTSAGESAGSVLGGAAQRAKGPAMAGGAALAGLAGGIVLATRGSRRKVLGVPVPGTRRPLIKVNSPRRAKVQGKDLLKAAGEVGSAGRQVGELASEVRLVRERIDSRRRRSPIEVVLDGLTARGPRR